MYEIVLHELPAHLTDLVYRFCWIIAFSIGLFVVCKLSVSLFEARSKSWKIAENKFGRQFKHPLLFIFFHLVLLMPDQKYFVDWSGGNRSLWGSATRWPGAWGALSTSLPTRCQNTEDNIPSITSILRILKTLFQVLRDNFQWSWSNKNTEALNDSLDPKDRWFFFTWNQVVMMQTTKIEISSDTFWFFARETFYFRCEGLDWDQFIQDYVMVNIFRAKWWSNSTSNTGHNYDLILSIPGHEEVRLETVSRHIACLQVTLSSF